MQWTWNTNPKTVTDIPKSLTHLPSFYQSPSEKDRFDRMGAQILAAKRRKNITMELCLYGWGNVEDWGYRYGQLWRTSNDIRKGTFISYIYCRKYWFFSRNLCPALLKVQHDFGPSKWFYTWYVQIVLVYSILKKKMWISNNDFSFYGSK